jgi:FKBP-type peptidyl-prolyl cis-trans isomerase
MMNNWKNLFALSAFLGGVSLYALRDPEVPTHTAPQEKGTPPASAAVVAKSAVDLKVQESRYLQALGYLVANNAGFFNFGFNAQDAEHIFTGMKDALNGKGSPITDPIEMRNMQEFFERKEKDQVEKNKREGKEFIEKKQAEGGWQKTPSGILYRIVKQGDAVRPNDDCTIEVDYEGKLITGIVVDSTYERGNPAFVYLGSACPGFVEAVGLVGQGGKIQAYISSNLTFGDEAIGQIPGGAVLEFLIEVHKITQPTLENEEPKGQEAPKADARVASPQPTAK